MDKLPFAKVFSRNFIVRQLLLLLIVVVATASMAYVYYQQRAEQERALLAIEESHHVQIQVSILSQDLRFVANTLTFLRDQIQMHGLAESDPERITFAMDILSFMEGGGFV